MRIVLVLLGIVLLVVAALMYFGMISIDQTRPGVVQAPQFHADVGKVTLGTEQKTVAVPTINVERPANSAAAAQ